MSFDPEATQRASPPVAPFGPRLALADLILALLLGSCVFVAFSTLAPDSWPGYYALHLWLPVWWLAGAAFGGTLLGDRGPLLTRLVRVARHKFFENGGGAYGAIAFVAFCVLEWRRLDEQIETFLADPSLQAFIRNLFDFSIASFMNTVYAAAWPAFWRKAFSGGQIWPAVGVAWALFESVRRGVPLLPRRGGTDNPPRAGSPPRVGSSL